MNGCAGMKKNKKNAKEKDLPNPFFDEGLQMDVKKFSLTSLFQFSKKSRKKNNR